MEKLYLVTRIEFDNSENRNPYVLSNVGLFTSDEKAKEYVSQNPPTYKGWDKTMYPQFTIEPVEIKG